MPSKPRKSKPAGMSSEVNEQLRTLAHDLANALEAIQQASYLLSQAKLAGADRRWAAMIEAAARDATRLNRELRETLRAQIRER
jgi:nitrogen-specific signal transduction histidine kinase